MNIALSKEERQDRRLGDGNLGAAEKAIREEGYVILDGVVDHDHLDMLWYQMIQDIETILARPEPPHQFLYGNVQQDPPPYAPFVFEDVIENPWVNQITRHILGEGVFNNFYSGNTNIPGSKLQPVHVDGGDLWKGLTNPQPPYRLIVNIALKDVTEENGSIELWPGTHLLMSNAVGEDIKINPDLVRERKAVHPPVRGNTEKGSILIRDSRAWHRGTPNDSDQPRFMIALTHGAAFMTRHRHTVFSREVASVFPSDAVTEYVLSDEPIPYLERHSTYDFPTQGYIEPLL